MHTPTTLDASSAGRLLKSTRGHRLYAMFVVFALPGMRRSEVLGLQWDDVDLDAQVLDVRRGLQRIDGELRLLPTKTARSRKTIPLPPMVVDALRPHVESHQAELRELGAKWPDLSYVLDTPVKTPIDPRNCTRIVQDECERAGLRRVRLHDFRHGSVSVLLSLSEPPRTTMEIVLHSTLEMTMSVYGHVSLDDKRAAMSRVGDLLDERLA